MRAVIVGGGILGLATASTLLRDDPDADVVVLERADAVGTDQTGHNSGVVHAGLYYAPGSLKARLCRRAMGLMRDFCAANGVPCEECGKLVVATDRSELPRFEALAERAAANEVPGLRRLDEVEMREIEPHVAGIAALHSPRTAIVDFLAVAEKLAAAVAAAGGEVGPGWRSRACVRVPVGRRSSSPAAKPWRRTVSWSVPASSPTGWRAPPASRPNRGSSPSAASTGSSAPSAPRW
jgi:L-2-hydroxyglutarate oxidase LhgO